MRIGLPQLINPRLAPLVEATRAFYARRTAGRGPSSRTELDAMRDRASQPLPSDPPAVSEVVTAGGRSVPVRVHTPATGSPTGVLLDIHGGGFYLGSAADNDVRNRLLAEGLGVAIVSVDYRLAPENPWPAAPDDCETAASWLADNARTRFGTDRLAMLGFSAGSTLAMTTLLRLRDRGVAAFGSAVLQCGTYDLSGTTPPGRLIAEEYFLTAYAGSAPDRTHPDISPVFADLTGLPPLHIVVGAEDILLRDNLALAAQLTAAGVELDLCVYPAAPHAFTHHPTPMARAALDDVESWLAARFAG